MHPPHPGPTSASPASRGGATTLLPLSHKFASTKNWKAMPAPSSAVTVTAWVRVRMRVRVRDRVGLRVRVRVRLRLRLG
eukprot:scaffold77176_cov69-Phaeocystis_antarctica.AAC.3